MEKRIATPSRMQAEAFEETQEIFLPVHGHIHLLPSEVAIIDHPAFQRLRRVRQLGFAHLVFPGGSHTRFEHSLGASHVAERIIRSVRANEQASAVRQPSESSERWLLTSIAQPVRRFVRLAALLHDIGHLPFGHTLEDELHHLPKHDGSDRLRLVADQAFEEYELIGSRYAEMERPAGGWSLRALTNALYRQDADELGLEVEPFDVVAAIVCKPPAQGAPDYESWRDRERLLSSAIPLTACRDIVGNTICADFLDYLFRDWHHLGKPHFEDKRLYEYMEARAPREGGSLSRVRFVINVGEPNKVRHDAITSILELLDARYKLAETVLFHRTKLALTGLLDRCLLETRDLFRQAGIESVDFESALERLLLEAADDELPNVLVRLISGSGGETSERLSSAVAAESAALASAIESPSGQETLPLPIGLPEGRSQGVLGSAQVLARRLAERLSQRCVYRLVYKLRMSDFPDNQSPDNPRVRKLIALYEQPDARQKFLSWIELLCDLPRGSVIMYCPPSAKMNAKVAEVNLLVDGEIRSFVEYENATQPQGLTCGALGAQVRRFYQLWSAQIFVHRPVWEALSRAEQSHLRAVLKAFLFQMHDFDGSVERQNIEASIRQVAARRLAAARGGTIDPTLAGLAGERFPSGLPFSLPEGS